MKLVICDPNLESTSGHHWFFDLSIAEGAAARGIQVTILANYKFQAGRVGSAEVINIFHHSCYERRSCDPVSGEHDDFCYFNDSLYEDLLQLPLALFGTDTLVLFPTINQRHLYGAVRWMKDFPAEQAPTFVVYLMLPSGIELKAFDADDFDVIDAMTALQYRLAFDLARQAGSRIHFFGTGLSHSREFSLLSRQTIDAHPVVLSGMTELDKKNERAAGEFRTALLFMGDAKEDKGFHYLPALVEALTRKYPDWHFVVHANCQRAWGICLDIHKVLVGLNNSLENFELHDKFVTSDEYAELLSQADLVVAPYSPQEYWRKSSGVVWEAIWCGVPVVVPRKTWLELELGLWDGDGECYDEWTASDIEDAVHRLVNRLDFATHNAEVASKAFRRRNTLRLLINQLSDVWMRRMSLSMVSKTFATEVVVPLDTHLNSNGWHPYESYEGTIVRWTQQQIVSDVRLDPNASWRFTFEGLSMMGDDQITRASITGDGRTVSELVAQLMPAGSNPRWRIQGLLGPSRTSSATTRIVMKLPYVRRPDGGVDVRELGVLFSAPMRFMRSAEGSSRIVVGHPLVEFVDGGTLRTVDQADVGYTVKEWAAANVAVDPTRALHVCAEVSVSASSVRSLQCSVNGVQAAQSVSALSPERLLVVWHVPATVVRSGGHRATLVFVHLTPDENGITLYGPPYACPVLESDITIDSTVAALGSAFTVPEAVRAPENGIIKFTGSDARPYMKDGWSYDEPDHVWMLGPKATLAVNMASFQGVSAIQLKLDVLTLGDVEVRNGRLAVLINEISIGEIQLSTLRAEHILEFSPELLDSAGSALITFISSISVQPERDQRVLAASFYSVTLLADKGLAAQ
ncbi:glycosyltransferase [Vitreoscilla filiformis]|jgi:glycosyltransferase involved in cell wall biosynthesis|nr:glycosyltransferase [Vitreoscilla filiformis]